MMMRAYIKEVRIKNYKTYRSARIRLNDGINTIIGPNGTGKSNCIEAILFGLGERSLKIFRANKFSDIVHNKNNEDIRSRKDVEVHVSLNIVDDKGEGHLFKRVYRPYDNAHIYHYNKRRVSRGTYISKLLTLGGGGFHYVYIPQGGILSQANISSKDLKKIVDDALGISEFEERRGEALSRLEKADIKLTALNEKQEILREIINKLLHQAINLEKKNNINRILKKLRAARYTLEIDHIKPQIEHNEDLLNTLKRREERIRRRILKIEDEINSVEKKINELEEEIEGGEMERYRELLNKRSILSSKTSIIKGEVDSALEISGRLSREIDDMREEIERIKAIVKEKSVSVKEIVKTNKKLLKEVERLREERDNIVEELRETEDILERTRVEKGEVVSKRGEEFEEILREQAEALALKKIDDLYRDRLKNLEMRISRFEKSLDELNVKMEDYKKRYEEVRRRRGERRDEYEKIMLKSQRISKEIRQAEKLLKKVDKYIDLMRRNEARQFLEYGREARYIVKVADEMGIRGVIGVLSDKIRGSREIISLLREALGKKWYSIIVENEEAANKVFRLSLELDKKAIIKIASSSYQKNVSPHERSIINVLRYPAKLKYLLADLFGHLVMVTNPEEAYKYLSQGLGVIHKKGEFIITSDSWIHEGRRRKLIISKDVSKLREIYHSFRDMIETRREDYYNILESIKKMEKEMVELVSEEARIEEIVKILEENIDFIKGLRKYYQKRYEELLKERERKVDTKKLADMEKKFNYRITDLDNMISSLQEKMGRLVKEKGVVEKKIAEAEKMIGINNSYLNNTREFMEELKNKKIKYRREMEWRRRRIKELGKKIGELKRNREEIDVQISSINKLIDEFSLKIKSLREKIDEFKRERNKFNEKWRGENSALSDIRDKISSLKYEVERLYSVKRRIEENRMGIGYLEPVYLQGIEDPLILDKIIEEYSDELESLDKEEYYPIPTAKNEYLEKIEPYKQFSLNKNQLEEERKAILKFIHQIEEEKEAAFNEGFNKIKMKFKKLFYDVFPESNVYIELEEPGNIDSGIVLYVELKGKPSLPVFSLSGGEKSLLIILFLLSVYSIPGNVVFLLDEIDAHIDPRSLNYFVRAILSQKKEGQIIFVTLPRDEALAKAADYLITIFFRDGVSRPIIIPKDKISEVVKNR